MGEWRMPTCVEVWREKESSMAGRDRKQCWWGVFFLKDRWNSTSSLLRGVLESQFCSVKIVWLTADSLKGAQWETSKVTKVIARNDEVGMLLLKIWILQWSKILDYICEIMFVYVCTLSICVKSCRSSSYNMGSLGAPSNPPVGNNWNLEKTHYLKTLLVSLEAGEISKKPFLENTSQRPLGGSVG